MPFYKMLLRDSDNPATSALHVVDEYCEAGSRNEAAEIFEGTFGPTRIISSPLKVDEVPEGKTILRKS